MLAVLAYVMAISLLSTAFISALNFSLDQQQHQRHLSAGETAAESGVHYAAALLEASPEASGQQTLSLADYEIKVEIEEGVADNTWNIRSTAYLGGMAVNLHETAFEAVLVRTRAGWALQNLERIRGVNTAPGDKT